MFDPYTHSPGVKKIEIVPAVLPKNFKDLEKLYKAGFKEFTKFLPKQARIVMCLPAYKQGRNDYQMFPGLDFAQDLGYNLVDIISPTLAKSLKFLKLTAKGELEKLLTLAAIDKPKVWDKQWRLVIFDIPEKHKYVRVVLRAKLKQLHFKKWQNSIWVSPYKIDADIEAELAALGNKFFVRLIKTTEINHTEDLEKMFG